MTEQKIPVRAEVPEENTWRLEDIFPTDEAWKAEYEALQKMPEQIAAYAGHLGESAERLLAYYRLSDELTVRLSKLMGYASQKLDQDTANGFYLDMRGKAMSVYVAISGAAAFATPEIIAIPDETMERFFAGEAALETYRRPITAVRRLKAHVLSAEHPLTAGTFVPLLESADRVLRRNAFQSYYTRLGEVKNTIAATLDAQFRQLKFFSNARHYGSTLEASLDANEVKTEIYTNLIEAVHGNLDKMYRYVALRKKLLGVDELHMYDVYTPVVEDAAVKIPFEEAKRTVLEALAVLGEDYTDLLREGFSSRWIDVYENQGKRSGAYSSGNSYPHPYVLLNHKDTLDSMFTLAHEMGHALHSYHSTKYQPTCTADYVIFVAEVASTCNEILLMRHLLGKTEDKKERAYLINHFLDQFKGTVYRQTMFAEFELEMGRTAENGETLTADALCEKYLALNRLYFGPEMVSDDEIALEWARIPHFFYNYYVFQYATGFSAAVAIANRILAEGAPAVADYKRFLSGGSSTDPVSLLKIAGVDMSTPEPVNSALELFGELVEELEKLV